MENRPKGPSFLPSPPVAPALGSLSSTVRKPSVSGVLRRVEDQDHEAEFGMRTMMRMSRSSINNSSSHNSRQQDDIVKGTDDDALVSKMSAVALGYLDDPFVKLFVKRPSRRPPLINRGSYLRTRFLDKALEKFMMSGDAETKKQVVSLGCGSDTRYFVLKAKGKKVHKYFEMDFEESTAKKAMVIKKNKALTDIIADPAMTLGRGGSELYAKDYCLLAGDLREFTSILVPKMTAQGFDPSLPTLFLSECVLIYIQPKDSDSIVEWVRSTVSASFFVLYEQINPADAFGSMMLRNLRSRQIELPGIHAYPSLNSQEQRFLSRGWTAAKAVDMNVLYDKYLDEDEKQRTSALEIFDEVEEWQLLASHYCIVWGHCLGTSLEAESMSVEEKERVLSMMAQVRLD